MFAEERCGLGYFVAGSSVFHDGVHPFLDELFANPFFGFFLVKTAGFLSPLFLDEIEEVIGLFLFFEEVDIGVFDESGFVGHNNLLL